MNPEEHAGVGRSGFAGLGQIGRAMARGLVDAGARLCVYDTDPGAYRPFEGVDAVISVNSAAELADRCLIIDVAVNTAEQVVDVVCGEAGILAGAGRGSVVLVHSTIDHPTLRLVAYSADVAGVHVLDAPVSGRWGEASIPDLAVMCGGSAEGFEAAEPMMRGYASMRVYLGPLGAGLDTKLALNLLRYLTMLGQPDDGWREARMLLDATGVVAPFEELVAHTGADLRNLGPRPATAEKLEGNERRARHNAALARKDLAAAVARAADFGVELTACMAAVPVVQRFWGLDQLEDDDAA